MYLEILNIKIYIKNYSKSKWEAQKKMQGVVFMMIYNLNIILLILFASY